MELTQIEVYNDSVGYERVVVEHCDRQICLLIKNTLGQSFLASYDKQSSVPDFLLVEVTVIYGGRCDVSLLKERASLPQLQEAVRIALRGPGQPSANMEEIEVRVGASKVLRLETGLMARRKTRMLEALGKAGYGPEFSEKITRHKAGERVNWTSADREQLRALVLPDIYDDEETVNLVASDLACKIVRYLETGYAFTD